MIPTLNRI